MPKNIDETTITQLITQRGITPKKIIISNLPAKCYTFVFNNNKILRSKGSKFSEK